MNFLLPSRIRRTTTLLTIATLVSLVCGCRTVRLTDPVTGPNYRPENVYRLQKSLPVTIRRVAVLPTTGNLSQSDLTAGLEVMNPIITDELAKLHRFELVVVSPEQLRLWTGRSAWRAEETLPASLLHQLHEQLDCDAVMFSRLTQYRPYAPLAVGLSLKLADIEKGDLLWAADEVVDASEPTVVNGARRYQLVREQLPSSLADSRSILNSPSTFGRYAANAVLQSLPAR